MREASVIIHDMLCAFSRQYGEAPTKLVLPKKLYRRFEYECAAMCIYSSDLPPKPLTYYSHFGDIIIEEEK